MTETNGLIIVERIDFLLKNRKENRTHLAEYLGVKPQIISNWATRGTVPQADILYRISKYLGCTSEYLMFGEEKEEFTQEERQMIFDFRTFTETEKSMIIALFQHAKEEQKKTSEKVSG